jgi:hypothetical protein
MASAASHWTIGKTADAVPEDQLNQAIWKSVKGRRSRMPAPRHTIIGEQPNSVRAND